MDHTSASAGGVPAKTEPNKFWGYCRCDCYCCVEIGDHHFCSDPRCKMPKTYDPNEKPRD
jgi:hypothetical protein